MNICRPPVKYVLLLKNKFGQVGYNLQQTCSNFASIVTSCLRVVTFLPLTRQKFSHIQTITLIVRDSFQYLHHPPSWIHFQGLAAGKERINDAAL